MTFAQDPLAQLPAMPPPPGVIPNFDDPKSIVRSLIITSIIFTTLAGVTVVIRVYTRTRIVRAFGSDDAVCVLAMLFSVSLTVWAIEGRKHGLGVHAWNVRLGTVFPGFVRWLHISVMLLLLLPYLAKLSILLLYLRLFKTHRRTRWAVYGVIIFSSLFVFIEELTVIFQCVPVKRAWDPRIKGRCLDYAANGFVQSTFNAFTDIVVLVLPLPVLRSLNIARSAKLALMGIFLTGGFATAVSIVRLVLYAVNYGNMDATYSSVAMWTWCIVEGNVGIMCACAVTMKPFVKRVVLKVFELTKGGSEGREKWSYGSIQLSGPAANVWPQPSKSIELDTHPTPHPADGAYLDLGETRADETV